MLTELRIHNFAIIDQLDLRFGPGLIILTSGAIRALSSLIRVPVRVGPLSSGGAL